MGQYKADTYGTANGDFLPYDKAVTGFTMVVPVLIGNSSKVADTRVACVRPSTIIGSSRRPKGVPNLGVHAIDIVRPAYLTMVAAAAFAVAI